MEIGQKSAIKYRRFDFIGKLYEDFKNLTNFNRTFFFHFFDFCDADRTEVRLNFSLFFKSASLSVRKSVKSRLIFNMRIFCCSILSNIIAVMCNNEALC